MIFDDFSMKFNIFFDDFSKFSKKRLAWIRTHARLQPSFYGHEAVAITTPPRPRVRVKGVHIEIMCNRTINTLNVKFTFRVVPRVRVKGVHIEIMWNRTTP